MRQVSTNKKIRTIQLIALIFFTVSGGPYGLEPLLTYAGEHTALFLLILVPLLWDIPSILTVLELNSMMPVKGGYYFWVKRSLGIRWAFYEGWWTWLYTFVDLAIYPVLFVEYLGFFFPEIHAYKILICLAIIWFSTILNIIGIVPVSKITLALGIIVICPFLVLIIIAIQHSASISIPVHLIKNNTYSTIGMSVYIIMWNFIGWDNTTTYSEEVNKPIRTYLISIVASFILIFCLYFIIVFISHISGINLDMLRQQGYPALGTLIGGKWLGSFIAFGGMASALGLYSSVLLSVSRVPKVMADDHLLPAILQKLHPRFKTPYVSLICCSLVVSFMILWTFEDLLIIDVTLYGAAIILEFIALIKLRVKAPWEYRPFKIPLGIWGLCAFFLIPILVYTFVVSAAFINSGQTIKPVAFSVLSLLSAEFIWRIIIKRNFRRQSR